MASNGFASRIGRLVATAVLVATTSCNWYYDTLPSPDDLVELVPWFDHMITSPAIFPYSRNDIPRRAVPGTVPIDGGEADWNTGNPAQLSYAFDITVADGLVSPLAPSEALARGDTLYGVFCALCHGLAGAGDGPVGPRLAAPSLLTERARNYSDGYMYSIIRYGRGVMPWYGDKIYDRRDRWALVNYVRALQGAAQ